MVQASIVSTRTVRKAIVPYHFFKRNQSDKTGDVPGTYEVKPVIKSKKMEFFVFPVQQQHTESPSILSLDDMRSATESIRRMHVLNALILTFVVSTKSGLVEEGCTAEECVGGSVAALIPARSGSKGIKHKNLSRIGNETLLARSLNTIHKTRRFDSVWVSTDGAEIAAEAASHGADVHWRDPATATDEASTVSAVQDFLRSHHDVDILAVIQCTSPFMQAEFLSNALRRMTTGRFDCVFSATRVRTLRWTDNEDGFVSPLNFNPVNRPRRQDWKGELIENGMFYIVKKVLVLEGNVLQNNRCGVYEVPKHFALEIDTESDLSIARLLSPLIDNGAISKTP